MTKRSKDDFDIATLLAAALDDEPPENFTESVMARLAGARTAVELARMIGVAPVDWIAEGAFAESEKGDDDARRSGSHAADAPYKDDEDDENDKDEADDQEDEGGEDR